MSRARAIASIVGAALCVLLPACVDLSPLPYDDSQPDAATADVVTSDVLVAECQQCLAAGSCASFYSACEANMNCAIFAGCMTDTACWSSPLTGDLTHLAPCLFQCGVKAGVTNQTSPAAILFSSLLLCAQDPTQCGSACVPAGDD